jgi:hypothetical protein
VIISFIIIYKIKSLTSFLIRIIFIANLFIIYLYKLMIFYKSILKKEKIYIFKKKDIIN